MTYADSSTTKQLCSVCNEGYYYDTTANECKEGWVANCKTYDNNVFKKCNTCMENFGKIDAAVLP